MKIRNGFVSNSSSSSFVVAFPEKPKNAEHVRKMMFGDAKEFVDNRDWCRSQNKFSALDIAKTVYNDMKNQKENDVINIIEGFGGWLEGAPESPDVWNRKDLTDEEKDNVWSDWNEEFDIYQKNTAMKFIKSHENMYIYTFEYGDDDGNYGSLLEHGGIFDKLEHVRVSRH